MAKMQVASDPETGASLTRRESRRIAELIVRSCRSRQVLERPSTSLIGLSVNDARIIRDDVIQLSIASGDTVRAISSHPAGEPIFFGAEMISYGSARILTAEDQLTVTVCAGLRGSAARLGAPAPSSEEPHVVYALVVIRQPYAGEDISQADLICVNGGVLHAAVSLPAEAGVAGTELEIQRDGDSVRNVPVPELATLIADARELVREADETSRLPSEIRHALDPESGTVTVLGTAITEPLPLEPGSSISLRAGGVELLKVTADLGHFI